MVLLRTMQQRRHVFSSGDPIERRLEKLIATQHGIISRRQVFDLGGTRGFVERRLAKGRWKLVYPGVYVLAGAPDSWRQRVIAACLACGEGAAASHRCAGTLMTFLGLEIGPVEVTISERRRVRRPGLILHRATDIIPADLTTIDAIPVTSPTRTLIDLAAVLDRDHLEEVLDDGLRRRLTSVRRLIWRIDAMEHRGRPGIGTITALVRARAHAGAAPESVLETRLFRLLAKAVLSRPAVQYPIIERGRVIARVDFAYPEQMLAIEAEGYRWHSSRVRFDRDLERRNRLTALGGASSTSRGPM